jgi:hypothetical protein
MVMVSTATLTVTGSAVPSMSELMRHASFLEERSIFRILRAGDDDGNSTRNLALALISTAKPSFPVPAEP